MMSEMHYSGVQISNVILILSHVNVDGVPKTMYKKTSLRLKIYKNYRHDKGNMFWLFMCNKLLTMNGRGCDLRLV